jgi:hypothetical protein
MLSFVVNGHVVFARELNTFVPQFNFERTLIDNLLKAIPQRGMNFHCAANDASGQFAIDELIIYKRGMAHEKIKSIAKVKRRRPINHAPIKEIT